jgi:hypothetical protein
LYTIHNTVCFSKRVCFKQTDPGVRCRQRKQQSALTHAAPRPTPHPPIHPTPPPGRGQLQEGGLARRPPRARRTGVRVHPEEGGAPAGGNGAPKVGGGGGPCLPGRFGRAHAGW